MRSPLSSVVLAAGFGLASLLAAPTAARAQDEEPVYKKVTPKQIEKILRELGYEYERVEGKEGEKVNRWRFQMSSYKVLLLSDGTDMQLFAGFDSTVSAKRMNEWNRTKRFNRAYIAKDKGVCVESDLDFAGGVTLAQIKEFIKLYKVVLEAFVKFVDE
jgi:Putative bacterial sensory transduction regulator